MGLSVLLVFSQSRSQSLSGFSGSFTQDAISARDAALGGTMVCLSASKDALYSNPALFVDTSATLLSFHYFKLYQLVNNLSSSLVFSENNTSGFGIGVLSNGDELYRETIFSTGYAHRLNVKSIPVDLGISGNLYYARFGSEAVPYPSINGQVTGFGLTLGMKMALTRSITIGLITRDFLNGLQWDTSHRGAYAENLPAQFRFGIGFLNLSGFQIGLDYESGLKEAPDRLRFGMEKSLFRLLYLRMGHRWSWTGLNENQLSIGMGISYTVEHKHGIQIDVAYSFEELPNTLRISISYMRF